MTTFKTVEQITNKFIKDGWGKNTSFEELSLEEVSENGMSLVAGIKKGIKYFKMNICNTIYDDKGKVVLYDIPQNYWCPTSSTPFKVIIQYYRVSC